MMIKSSIILSLLLSINLSLQAQELNVAQTLAYINKQLNDKDNKFFNEESTLFVHTFISEASVNVQNIDEVTMNDYSYNIQIEHGYLVIIRTFTKNTSSEDNEGNWHKINFTSIIENVSIPIKDIDDNFNSGFQLAQCSNSFEKRPSLLLISTYDKEASPVIKTSKELDYRGNKIKKKIENLKYFCLEFSNANLICNKLSNAFTHLVELASTDSNYNTIDVASDNDPFANPIKNESTNSNSITTTNSNSIPMTKDGGVYEIPVILNESLKLNFIFDAGASDVSISPDVALTLIRTGTLIDKDFLGSETYQFADGTKAKSKIFTLKEIQIGNKKVFNVRASIATSINAPLLLGQSVLNKFGKVSIDYANGVIIFQN